MDSWPEALVCKGLVEAEEKLLKLAQELQVVFWQWLFVDGEPEHLQIAGGGFVHFQRVNRRWLRGPGQLRRG